VKGARVALTRRVGGARGGDETGAVVMSAENQALRRMTQGMRENPQLLAHAGGREPGPASAGVSIATVAKEHRAEGQREEGGWFRDFGEREMDIPINGCKAGRRGAVDGQSNEVGDAIVTTGGKNDLPRLVKDAGRGPVGIGVVNDVGIDVAVIRRRVVNYAQRANDLHGIDGQVVVAGHVVGEQEVLIGVDAQRTVGDGGEQGWVGVGGSVGNLDEEVTCGVVPREVILRDGARRVGYPCACRLEWIGNRRNRHSAEVGWGSEDACIKAPFVELKRGAVRNARRYDNGYNEHNRSRCHLKLPRRSICVLTVGILYNSIRDHIILSSCQLIFKVCLVVLLQAKKGTGVFVSVRGEKGDGSLFFRAGISMSLGLRPQRVVG
jgi:hypothetical protein